MIRIYTWKHLAIAVILTLAICTGILYFSEWNVNKFTNSLEKVDPNALNQHPRISNRPLEKIKKDPNLRTTTESMVESETDDFKESNTESVENPNDTLVEETLNTTEEGFEEQEAAIDDFLTYLDELEQKEFDELLENLDIIDVDDKGVNTGNDEESEEIGALVDQESEEEEQEQEQEEQEVDDDIENANPSRMVINMIESGVASLDSLIFLMEESSEGMPEEVRERFEPVLGTLRTMQENGGRVVVHRPSQDPSDWMLLFINSSRTSRFPRIPIRSRENGRVEFVPFNPRERNIIINERNSTIID